MKERFEELIRSVCATLGLPNPEKMISGMPFTINHVVLSLTHKPEVNDKYLFVHVDFGEIPKRGEVEACYELLRENFFDFPITNSSIGISSTTGRAVYATAYPLDKFVTEDFIVALTALTCQAKRWQVDNSRITQKTALGAASHRPYFLNSALPPPKSVSRKIR